MPMKTSARNQFRGIVKAIKPGQVNAELTLSIAEGVELVAQITLESLHELGLAEGKEVWALVKAQWVTLASGGQSLRVSARNRFHGKVAKVVPGAVNSEVQVALGGGTVVTSIITKESVDSLGVAVGQELWAFFKAGSVILAVEG